MFRRLAREAVIFALLGMLLSGVGCFVYLHHSQARYIQSQRETLSKPCSHLTQPVRPGIDPPEGYDYFGSALSDEPMVTRAECNLVFGTNLPSLMVDDETLRYAHDFYTRRDAALAEGTRIKSLKIDDGSNAIVSGVVGLYGFAGGIGLWILYRLARFAVKG